MDIKEFEGVKAVLKDVASTTRTLVDATRDKQTISFAVYRGRHPRQNNNQMYYHLVDLSSHRTLCYMRDLNKIIEHAKTHGIAEECIVLNLRTPVL